MLQRQSEQKKNIIIKYKFNRTEHIKIQSSREQESNYQGDREKFTMKPFSDFGYGMCKSLSGW